jgi:hypothetical protein
LSIWLSATMIEIPQKLLAARGVGAIVHPIPASFNL